MTKYYPSPVATVYGIGSVASLGNKLKDLKCTKVMIACDKICKSVGILDKVTDSLKAAGISFVVYDEVTPDAPDALVDAGAAIAKAEKIDGIVGVGGGSSMDTAKAIACLMGNPGSIDDYLTDPPTFFASSAIPIILIPTTSGTGAECTAHAVILDTKNNRKPAVFQPIHLAVVDPELTVTMPPMTTATTGIDAFTHASEAITTNNSDPRSDVMAVAAIKKLAAYLPTAVRDGKNIEARDAMALAANWAGLALEDAGVHFGHSIADGLSAVCKTAHGLNCAWGSPELLKLIAPTVPEKVKIVGEALGINFFGTETPEEIGEKTASAVRVLMRCCKIPAPATMGFAREAFVTEAAEIAFSSPLKFACPVQVTLEDVQALFGRIYDNY